MELLHVWGKLVLRDSIMKQKTIEGWIISPPERDEVIVELLHRDGDGWGEIYRDKGLYVIKIFAPSGEPAVILDADELVIALQLSLKQLRDRLEIIPAEKQDPSN
jgi:hypothetical protein